MAQQSENRRIARSTRLDVEALELGLGAPQLALRLACGGGDGGKAGKNTAKVRLWTTPGKNGHGNVRKGKVCFAKNREGKGLQLFWAPLACSSFNGWEQPKGNPQFLTLTPASSQNLRPQKDSWQEQSPQTLLLRDSLLSPSMGRTKPQIPMGGPVENLHRPLGGHQNATGVHVYHFGFANDFA